MPYAFDGTRVPELTVAPCGQPARWDYGSECSYRCEACNATIGSIGMPKTCHDIMMEQRDADQIKKVMGFPEEL